MKTKDINAYWQSYTDLIELWAKGVWDEADMAAHFVKHGKSEGRVVADIDSLPDDWSDTLYFTSTHDHFAWWWQKGVIDSGAYMALLEGDTAMERGCVSRNRSMQERAAMSQPSLEQIVQNARENLGDGPLRDIMAGKMYWGGQSSTGLLAMEDAVKDAAPDGCKYLIVLPWLESGGAELVGLWHYLAARDLGLDPLILLGDHPNVTERFVAHNVNTLNLPELYEKVTDQVYSSIAMTDRIELLTMTLEVIAPERMHLIHSYTGYSALSGKATKPRIRAACDKIYVSAFCPHIHPDGHYDGYFRYIPALVDTVDQFIFDNTWYLKEMAHVYGLGDAKTCALKYPVDETKASKPGRKARKTVLWASRFDSQKNPQIVGEIAAKMPDTDFVMYGRRVMGDVEIDWDKMPDNVTDMGEFFSIDELPTKTSFAFLYTSKFDGTPNILLEIASRGLPIVTPDVGGISDFLGTDWPLYVDDPEDVDGFVKHLEHLKSDPKFASQRTKAQFKLLEEERSFSEFKDAFSKVIAI